MMAITAIALWIVVTVLAQDPAGKLREAADTLELSRLETVWNEAHTRGDADALDRLWAEDFVVTVPGMPLMTKPETIGMWRTGRMTFQRYQTSDIRIRVYADAAVVTGRLQRTRSLSDKVVVDDWRFTKVYVGRADRWQVVAFHASALVP